MLEKEKLLHKDQIPQMNVFTEDRVENVYAYAMHQQSIENKTLQESKFHSKDSAQMQDVKAAMQTITELMQRTIPQEKEDFAASYKLLTEGYAKLITACQTYLEGHPHPITTAGKTRKRLVHGTLAMAQKESAQLQNATLQLKPHFQSGEPLLWGNVLGIIRGVSFDLKDHIELDREGAAISELKVLKTADNKKYFYKADEKLSTPRAALAEEYKDLKTEKEKHILENLLLLMNYSVDRIKDRHSSQIDFEFHHAKIDDLLRLPEGMYKPPILSELQENNTDRVRGEIKQFLRKLNMPELELDLDDKKTWEMFKEVLPKYWRLRSRLGVSLSAGIPLNQSLSQRNVATSRMAAVFGMPSLVVATNKATLYENGTQIKDGDGIVMSQAKGVPYYDVWLLANRKRENIIYTPEAMQQLSCLQLFDTLCGQCDRHWANFYADYKEENGKYIITGIQGIDNDLSFGDLQYKHIASTVNMHLPAFEDDDGNCSMTFLDKNMVETMRTLSKENLDYYLGDLLKPEYIDAMWDRMERMLWTIDISVRKKSSLLLEKEQWKDDIVKSKFVQLHKGYF